MVRKVSGSVEQPSAGGGKRPGASEAELERGLRRVDDQLAMALRETRLALTHDGELPDAVSALMAERIELEDALRVARGELASAEASPIVDELARRASKLDAAGRKLAPLANEFERRYVALARLRKTPSRTPWR